MVSKNDLIGPAASGLKMGPVVPGCDLTEMVINIIKKCESKGLVEDQDILCITESVVARAQNNYVTIDTIAEEIRDKLELKPDNNIGVLFPILSRNRFSMVLKAIARAVNRGKVTLQLSFPDDEVGNLIISRKQLEKLNIGPDGVIEYCDIKNSNFCHPITNVDYKKFYYDIIKEEGAEPHIILSNKPEELTNYNPDGIIVASIHRRNYDKKVLSDYTSDCITLQDICNTGDVSSKWGLLGSNLSVGEKLKLLPKDGDDFVLNLQKNIMKRVGIKLHILIYGDGAYKDPTTGIYELADPQTTFGITPELKNRMRQGIKYKYFADQLYNEGKDIKEIALMLNNKKKSNIEDDFETEGTTPRKLTDVLASLADLVSGSADAGTPLVLIKNFQ